MAETVIITGRDLDVDHQTERPDPKRRRPVAYNPPAPTADIGDTIARGNPYWSDEANRDADENPELRPIDLARKWKDHRR